MQLVIIVRSFGWLYLFLLEIFIIFYKIHNLFYHCLVRSIDFIYQFQHSNDPPKHILWSVVYQNKTFNIRCKRIRNGAVNIQLSFMYENSADSVDLWII